MFVYVIGTSKIVSQENWQEFCSVVRAKIPEVVGLIITDGRGCCNIGLCMSADNEAAVRQLTYALMPAKYAGATDAPWAGDIYNLSDVGYL